jgi:dolichyl-phosphate beta-glucosyltransferase
MPRVPIELSVVIPAYNEEGRLGPTLDRVAAYLAGRGLGHEVLVVDDGSTDGTAALVEAHGAPGLRLLRQPANRGKGAALKAGVAASTGERVLVTDADLSAPIAEIERLEPSLAGGADLVFGSRAAPGARLARRQPFYRELMGKTFNRIIRLLGVHGITDTQCGFKLLTGTAARDLFPRLTVDRFAFDVELVWLARRRGYLVAEVGVEWADSGESRVHALRDSVVMLRDVIGMRWRHRGDG